MPCMKEALRPLMDLIFYPRLSIGSTGSLNSNWDGMTTKKKYSIFITW